MGTFLWVCCLQGITLPLRPDSLPRLPWPHHSRFGRNVAEGPLHQGLQNRSPLCLT